MNIKAFLKEKLSPAPNNWASRRGNAFKKETPLEGKSLEGARNILQRVGRGVPFWDPNTSDTAERIGNHCRTWRDFLDSCKSRGEMEEMRPYMEEFIDSASSLIGNCQINAVANLMVSSLASLTPFYPQKMFPALVFLSGNMATKFRDNDAPLDEDSGEDGAPERILSIPEHFLVHSARFIKHVEHGDDSVYRAIEHFAGGLESNAAENRKTLLHANPDFSVFLQTASSRILLDSGLLERCALCLVPREFVGTLSYGFLYGTWFSQSERLVAMARTTERFTHDDKVAFLFRLYVAGSILPTLQETPFGFVQMPAEGSLLSIYKKDLRESREGPLDIRIRKQMARFAMEGLRELGISPDLPMIVPSRDFQ
jgi:hypothetical protein